MPFKLWPSQVRVMWALMTKRLVIILKARQLGISWICCWYALWLCMFHPGKLVLLFSKSQDDANELLRRVLVLYERLPDWYRAASPPLVRAPIGEAAWANGSRILSLAATKSGGRGHAASLVILDEAAFQAWAGELYTALKPTIDAGGQLVILSTANGIGNLFHLLWTRAVAGLNDFLTIFLPWWSRPGRDAAWYAAQLAEYTDPQMVKQEYPSTANEAFLVSGRVRFKPDWITAQARNVRTGLPAAQLPVELAYMDGLTVYVAPIPNWDRRVVIGADVAEGLEHGDYSAATVLDAETLEELAHLHGHWEPDEFGALLDTLARAYQALLAVERNNHGHAVLVKLKTLGTPRIYTAEDDRRGWLTNLKTKPLSIDKLAEALRDELVTIHTQATLDELQIYRYAKDSTKTGAPDGYNDDRVMSWAIALQVANAPQNDLEEGYNPLDDYRG